CRKEGVPGEPHRRRRLSPRTLPAGHDPRHARGLDGRGDGDRAAPIAPCRRADRLRLARADGRLLAPPDRRDREVGADPPLRLASRREGRTDAGLGAHPRRHHGDGRGLHDRPAPRALRARARRPRRGGDGGRGDRAPRRGDRARPDRHQAGARLLDRQPARLHVPWPRRRRARRRRLPPRHACLLQGAPLPRRGERDPRTRRGARPGTHGRPPALHADHVLDHDDRHGGDRRRAACLGVLQQGRDPARRHGRPARAARPRRRRLRGRVPDRLLHRPAPLPHLPRRVPGPRGGAAPRARALRRRGRAAALRGRPRGRVAHRPRGHRRDRQRGCPAGRRDERRRAPPPDRQRPALRAFVPVRRTPDPRLLRAAVMGLPLLTLIVFSPLAGAIILAFLPREPVAGLRRAALVFSLVPLGFALSMLERFQPGEADFQLVERAAWIPQWGIDYRLGVDGVSLFLVLLTALLVPIVVLASWGDITRRVKEFFAFLLILEVGMLGAFLATDLFLFYVFWELMLVPMYFLIGVWGGARR